MQLHVCFISILINGYFSLLCAISARREGVCLLLVNRNADIYLSRLKEEHVRTYLTVNNVHTSINYIEIEIGQLVMSVYFKRKKLFPFFSCKSLIGCPVKVLTAMSINWLVLCNNIIWLCNYMQRYIRILLFLGLINEFYRNYICTYSIIYDITVDYWDPVLVVYRKTNPVYFWGNCNFFQFV